MPKRKSPDLEEIARLANNVKRSFEVLYNGLAGSLEDEPSESSVVQAYRLGDNFAWLMRFETGRYSLFWVDPEGELYGRYWDNDKQKWIVTKAYSEN